MVDSEGIDQDEQLLNLKRPADMQLTCMDDGSTGNTCDTSLPKGSEVVDQTLFLGSCKMVQVLQKPLTASRLNADDNH